MGGLPHFTAPWILPWLGLALVPLWIHRLRPTPRAALPWSAGQYLRQASRQYARSLLWSQRLLMLTRCLLIAGCVLVAAGPRWAPVDEVYPTAARLILLDNSLSMQTMQAGQTAWERGLAVVRQELTGLPADTPTAFILTCPGPQQASDWRAAGEWLAQLEAWKCSSGASDWSRVALLARQRVLSAPQAGLEPGLRPRVLVVHDRRDAAADPPSWERTLWSALQSPDPALPSSLTSDWLPPQIRAYDVGLAERVNNVWVHALTVRSLAPVVGELLELEVSLGQVGDAINQGKLQWLVDGQPVEEVPVTFVGNRASVRWQHRWERPGEYVVQAQWSLGDDLQADNECRVLFQVRERLQVLLVGNRLESSTPSLQPARQSALDYGGVDDPTELLELALTAGGLGPFSVTRAATWNWYEQDLSRYDCLIFGDLPDWPAPAVDRIQERLKQGQGLLLIAAESAEPEAYRQLWQSLRAADVAEWELTAARVVPAAPWLWEAPEHPFASALGPDWGRGIAARCARGMAQVEGGGQVLARWGDQPALVQLTGNQAPGKLLVYTGSLSDGPVLEEGAPWSNLPFSPGFIPWSHQLIRYLAHTSARVVDEGAASSATEQGESATNSPRAFVSNPDVRESPLLRTTDVRKQVATTGNSSSAVETTDQGSAAGALNWLSAGELTEAAATSVTGTKGTGSARARWPAWPWLVSLVCLEAALVGWSRGLLRTQGTAPQSTGNSRGLFALGMPWQGSRQRASTASEGEPDA